MRYTLLVVLLILITSSINAQSLLPDSTLYLLIDKRDHYLKFRQRKKDENGKWYPVYRYILFQPYTQPPPKLRFVSASTLSIDTVAMRELKNYPTYTLDSLTLMLHRDDPENSLSRVVSSYLEGLQHIYLVETDTLTLGSKATITKLFPSQECEDSLYSIYHPESFYEPLSPQDTTLYLVFDRDKHYKYDNYVAIDPITHKEHPENTYVLDHYLYDGYPLEFISFRKENADTIQLNHLNRMPTVTPDQLRTFIGDYYGCWNDRYYGAAYLDCLRHIYLVEKNKHKQTATITEVYLNVGIE